MYKSLTRTISQIIQFIFISLIKIYQCIVSPWFFSSCRFYPSCSSYAEKAIKQLGVIQGMYLSIFRLLRCQPFHLGGIDLIPIKHNKKTM
ncbi:membrane protein insertion efficiency factor YidD [Coxiella endosymbiont of Amblyomma nuttalli]|uniref:membrane protein insertion efficiency factor YidD n=1 Tax=Coxiella endosymbiont of Amblyomma nuttalli TaxID=2749996 RepID=UPI001BAE3CE2|nr:membrane protein insertion efficiency factor YidD [Coxiella endosymbiont of Amblyomma nuttalli]QTS83563.1 Putative membrane protein insertion efficiency factor [Coxiella endosymbiont of Amblyomma nuttalli]